MPADTEKAISCSAILLLGLALSRLGEEARFLLSSWVMSEPQLLVDQKLS